MSPVPGTEAGTLTRTRPADGTVVSHYVKWCHAMANTVAPAGSPDHDDLVQELLIAIWQAAEKADPDQGGATAPWLTQAARWRLNDVVKRHTWTGHTKVRGKAADPLLRPHPSLDDLVADQGEPVDAVAMAEAEELLEAVALAYHSGQIAEAVSALPARQRAYVVQRFWKGRSNAEIAARARLSPATLRHDWEAEIRPALCERLAHLSEV